MNTKEACDILNRQYDDDNVPTLVEILRAHATLWRSGRDPQHADYCNDAADEIERLQAALAAVTPNNGGHTARGSTTEKSDPNFQDWALVGSPSERN